MKRLLIFASFGFCQCKSAQDRNIEHIDNLVSAVKEARITDSLGKEIEKNIWYDTIGLENAAIKVLSAKLVQKAHSNYKDIRLTWQNVSDKKVTAI